MSSHKKTPCKFCGQTLTINDGFYDEMDNQIRIAEGCWTEMYIGVNRSGKVVIRACGADYTEDYIPKYCPECGRKLRDDKDE